MNCMSQTDAFLLNDYVESFLTEEETVTYDGYIPKTAFSELKEFAKSFLQLPDKIENIRWKRRGNIQQEEFIQKFSNKYIKPLLSRPDAILIGDTAFCINLPPHDIHVDNRDFRAELTQKKGIIGYKTVVIPLEIDTTDYPFLFTTNQYFYGPTTRFRKGCSVADETDTECIRQKSCGIYFSYDYETDGVKYLSNNKLSKKWYTECIDYDVELYGIPYSTFEGFSIEKENLWKPNNIIMFDSSRIHFGSNITKKNASYKLGISLNYGLKI